MDWLSTSAESRFLVITLGIIAVVELLLSLLIFLTGRRSLSFGEVGDRYHR